MATSESTTSFLSSKRTHVPWMLHRFLGLDPSWSTFRVVPNLKKVGTWPLKDVEKKKLRDLFIECTKTDVRVNNIMSRARLYCFKLWNKCMGEQLLIYAFFPEPHKRSFEHVPAGPWKSPSRKPKQLQNLSRSQRLLQRVLQRVLQRSASQGVNLHPQHQLQLAGQIRLPLRLRRERSRRPSSFCAVLRCWPMWQIHGWDMIKWAVNLGLAPSHRGVL